MPTVRQLPIAWTCSSYLLLPPTPPFPSPALLLSLLALLQSAAEAVGKKIAEACLAKNINKVAFDRGGFTFHGRIKVGGAWGRTGAGSGRPGAGVGGAGNMVRKGVGRVGG